MPYVVAGRSQSVVSAVAVAARARAVPPPVAAAQPHCRVRQPYEPRVQSGDVMALASRLEQAGVQVRLADLMAMATPLVLTIHLQWSRRGSTIMRFVLTPGVAKPRSHGGHGAARGVGRGYRTRSTVHAPAQLTHTGS